MTKLVVMDDVPSVANIIPFDVVMVLIGVVRGAVPPAIEDVVIVPKSEVFAFHPIFYL